MACRKSSSHPWLNGRVLHLVKQKADASGTELESEKAKACSEGILQEFHKWVQEKRTENAKLPRGSKQWWKATQELLMKS